MINNIISNTNIKGEKNTMIDNNTKEEIIRSVEEAEAWEKLPTTINGVYIVKTPEHNNHKTVFVELNPTSYGIPLKRRGIFLKNPSEFIAIKELCEDERIIELLETINEIYSKRPLPRIEI